MSAYAYAANRSRLGSRLGAPRPEAGAGGWYGRYVDPYRVTIPSYAILDWSGVPYYPPTVGAVPAAGGVIPGRFVPQLAGDGDQAEDAAFAASFSAGAESGAVIPPPVDFPTVDPGTIDQWKADPYLGIDPLEVHRQRATATGTARSTPEAVAAIARTQAGKVGYPWYRSPDVLVVAGGIVAGYLVGRML